MRNNTPKFLASLTKDTRLADARKCILQGRPAYPQLRAAFQASSDFLDKYDDGNEQDSIFYGAASLSLDPKDSHGGDLSLDILYGQQVFVPEQYTQPISVTLLANGRSFIYAGRALPILLNMNHITDRLVQHTGGTHRDPDSLKIGCVDFLNALAFATAICYTIEQERPPNDTNISLVVLPHPKGLLFGHVEPCKKGTYNMGKNQILQKGQKGRTLPCFWNPNTQLVVSTFVEVGRLYNNQLDLFYALQSLQNEEATWNKVTGRIKRYTLGDMREVPTSIVPEEDELHIRLQELVRSEVWQKGTPISKATRVYTTDSCTP